MPENRPETAELERLRSRVIELEVQLREQKAHTEALDRNWATVHEMGVGAFRNGLGMPDASIPAMIMEIQRLQSFESILKN